MAARTEASIVGLRAEAKTAKAKLTADGLLAQKAAGEARKHSFNILSEAWLDHMRPSWADGTYDKARGVIRNNLQPKIGTLDMRTLRSKDVASPWREIASRAPSMAKKAVEYLNGVVTYCVQEGVRDDDQVLALNKVLPSHEGGHTGNT